MRGRIGALVSQGAHKRSLSNSFVPESQASGKCAGLLCHPSYRCGALVIGFAALSHWFPDALAHRPDLPLYSDVVAGAGLGLWDSMPATLIVELGMSLAGVWLCAPVALHEALGVCGVPAGRLRNERDRPAAAERPRRVDRGARVVALAGVRAWVERGDGPAKCRCWFIRRSVPS